MISRLLLTAGLIGMASSAYAADTTCTAPIAPIIPTVAELTAQPVETARTTIMNANANVKKYRTDLAPYRTCIDTMTRQSQQVQAMATAAGKSDQAKAESDKITALNAKYDASIDSEKQVASAFNALIPAHCARDKEWAACPK